MKRLAVGFIIPVVLGLALGALALSIGFSRPVDELDSAPDALSVLRRAESALFVQSFLVDIGDAELAAFGHGGLRDQPLEADEQSRSRSLAAYRELSQRLDRLEANLAGLELDSLLSELLDLWHTHLKLAVTWLELQEELAAEPAFVDYLDRPLLSEHPYLVEVDRLLARTDVERARAMGAIVLGQRRLVWRRSREISRAVMVF